MNPKQISIFLEDRKGKLYAVLSALKEKEIKVLALDIAEGDGFGILRIVVSDPDKTAKVLRRNQFVIHLTEVIVADTEQTHQGFLNTLKALTENDVNIRYIYGFTRDTEQSQLFVFRVDQYSRAIHALSQNNIRFLSQEQLRLGNFSSNQ